ncbi:MAG: hypothetical protein ABIZ80_06410 [Bryobacteraceae bacterium]
MRISIKREYSKETISKAQVQLCIVHLVRASMNDVTWKDRKKVRGSKACLQGRDGG